MHTCTYYFLFAYITNLYCFSSLENFGKVVLRKNKTNDNVGRQVFTVLWHISNPVSYSNPTLELSFNIFIYYLSPGKELLCGLFPVVMCH